MSKLITLMSSTSTRTTSCKVICALAENSIKRGDVLGLDVSNVAKALGVTLSGAWTKLYDYSMTTCGVLKVGLLSYSTILVPLAAVFAEHRNLRGPVVGGAQIET